MEEHLRKATAAHLIVWIVLSWALLPWSPVGGPAVATGARPVGHPPPATGLPGDPPELAEILDAYTEAAGGRAALEWIETRVVQARVVTDLPSWDPPVFEVDTLAVYSDATGRYLIVHRTPEGTVLEGCDGATTWKRGVEGNVFASGAMGGRDAWLVDPRYPLGLTDYFPDMVYLGTAALAGRLCHVVDTDGEHAHRLYFDTETGLLARLGYNTTIMRYGELDGVKIPFEVEHSRKGGSSTFVFDSVAHNVPIDERLFGRPDGY